MCSGVFGVVGVASGTGVSIGAGVSVLVLASFVAGDGGFAFCGAAGVVSLINILGGVLIIDVDVEALAGDLGLFDSLFFLFLGFSLVGILDAESSRLR